MTKKFLTGLRLVNLPSDPSVGSEGELYFNTSASVAKIYKSGAWSELGAGGGSNTTVSTTEPVSPETGDAWYKNDTGEFYIYDGTYWVEVNGVISLTQEQVQDYVAPLFTSASGTNVVAIYDDINNVINLNTSGSLISVDSIVYPDYITFDTTPETSSASTGTIFWDSGDGLPAAVLNSNVTIGLGQEQIALVKNDTGSSIPKGTVVYINGAQGQRPTIALSDADTEITSSKTFGLTAETIADEAEGFVTTFGVLRGVNTLGLAEGAALWLSSTAGGYTTTIPEEPAHSVFLGYVVKAHATAGEIFVNIQNGYELNELHGVLVNGTLEDQVLRYDNATGLWKNTPDNVVTARNYSNVTIDAFMPVYFDTQFFESTEITFDIADASSQITLPANGVTTASVAHGSYSKIVTSGIVSGMDLSSYTDGDLMYVGASGGFTKVRPTGTNYIQPVARVLSVDNGTFYFFGNNFVSSIDTLPNLTSGSIWYGVSGRPAITALTSDIVNEGVSNLFFTEERAQDATSSMITNGVHTGISVEYVDASNIFNLTNTGVTSLTGTANEISVSASVGNITIGIPDSPTFVTPNIGVATATSINGTTIPSSSTLVVSGDLSPYLTISSASSTYQPIGSYLTSETDPIFVASDAYNITSASTSAWNTAYGWGDHSLAGYSLTSHNHSLDSLSNVVITGTPTDGQAIVWDTTTSKWVNETVSGGASYPDQTGNNGKFLQTNGASVSWQNVDFTGYLTEASASITYQPIGSYLTSIISDQVSITNTTPSTSTSTGALVISGGLGVGDSVWIEGDLHVAGTTITENTQTVATHDNMIYLNAAFDSIITNAVYASGSITYTADNLYVAGMDIRVTGVDPSGFNISSGDGLTVASATPTQFIVVKSDPGSSYVSGGTAHAKTEANPDLGFAGGYYSAGYAHAGLFRDASDGIFKVFDGYTPEPDEAVNIDTTHPSFSFAPIKVESLDVVDSSTTRTNLGLAIGTDVQAYNATLAAVAAGTYSGDDSITTLGTIATGTWNGSTIGYQYGGTGLTSLGSAGYVLAVNATVDGLEWVEMTGGGGGSSFTNSSELAALLSDETGSGSVVFSNSASLAFPVIAYADIQHPDITLGSINSTEIGLTTPDNGNFTSVQVDSRLITQTYTGTTSVSDSGLAASSTNPKSVEYTIFISNGTNSYTSKLLMLANGSTPITTEYGILQTSPSFGAEITVSGTTAPYITVSGTTTATQCRLARRYLKI